MCHNLRHGRLLAQFYGKNHKGWPRLHYMGQIIEDRESSAYEKGERKAYNDRGQRGMEIPKYRNKKKKKNTAIVIIIIIIIISWTWGCTDGAYCVLHTIIIIYYIVQREQGNVTAIPLYGTTSKRNGEREIEAKPSGFGDNALFSAIQKE